MQLAEQSPISINRGFLIAEVNLAALPRAKEKAEASVLVLQNDSFDPSWFTGLRMSEGASKGSI